MELNFINLQCIASAMFASHPCVSHGQGRFLPVAIRNFYAIPKGRSYGERNVCRFLLVTLHNRNQNP